MCIEEVALDLAVRSPQLHHHRVYLTDELFVRSLRSFSSHKGRGAGHHNAQPHLEQQQQQQACCNDSRSWWTALCSSRAEAATCSLATAVWVGSCSNTTMHRPALHAGTAALAASKTTPTAHRCCCSKQRRLQQQQPPGAWRDCSAGCWCTGTRGIHHRRTNVCCHQQQWRRRCVRCCCRAGAVRPNDTTEINLPHQKLPAAYACTLTCACSGPQLTPPHNHLPASALFC